MIVWVRNLNGTWLGDSLFSMWNGWRSVGDIQLMIGLVLSVQDGSTHICSTLPRMDGRWSSIGNLEWILLTWRILVSQAFFMAAHTSKNKCSVLANNTKALWPFMNNLRNSRVSFPEYSII